MFVNTKGQVSHICLEKNRLLLAALLASQIAGMPEAQSFNLKEQQAWNLIDAFKRKTLFFDQRHITGVELSKGDVKGWHFPSGKDGKLLDQGEMVMSDGVACGGAFVSTSPVSIRVVSETRQDRAVSGSKVGGKKPTKALAQDCTDTCCVTFNDVGLFMEGHGEAVHKPLLKTTFVNMDILDIIMGVDSIIYGDNGIIEPALLQGQTVYLGYILNKQTSERTSVIIWVNGGRIQSLYPIIMKNYGEKTSIDSYAEELKRCPSHVSAHSTPENSPAKQHKGGSPMATPPTSAAIPAATPSHLPLCPVTPPRTPTRLGTYAATHWKSPGGFVVEALKDGGGDVEAKSYASIQEKRLDEIKEILNRNPNIRGVFNSKNNDKFVVFINNLLTMDSILDIIGRSTQDFEVSRDTSVEAVANTYINSIPVFVVIPKDVLLKIYIDAVKSRSPGSPITSAKLKKK